MAGTQLEAYQKVSTPTIPTPLCYLVKTRLYDPFQYIVKDVKPRHKTPVALDFDRISESNNLNSEDLNHHDHNRDSENYEAPNTSLSELMHSS